jgi:AAA+ ATPase superfamily predicted ATPase
MFLGREKELENLNHLLYHQGKFQLYVLYGRRRIGKTTLLTEFCKDKKSIFYSAEQSNDKMNLQKFSAQIFDCFEEQHLEPFQNWENAFLYIAERQNEQPIVVVLDEFPYLANMNHALLSTLQHLIDHKLQYSKLFLVLCGSYMGFMEKEVLSAKSPLFGRRTAQLHMKPFDYLASTLFMKGFSQEEQLMLYGAFGGTALYLQMIQPDKSFKENLMDSMLKQTGYLYEEPLLLLRQEVQEPGIYCAIIEAIANGAAKASEIASKTGEDSSKCLKYIHTLQELGIIYKELPFGEKESSRKTLYGISDFMFRFWYRYIAGNKTLLETDAREIVWQRRIAPDYSNYMGQVFETVCKEYLLRQNSKGVLPILFTQIGRWWGSDPKTKSQVEIDLVARDGDTYLFAECKWRNELTDLAVLQGLVQKAAVFGANKDKVYYALFSKSGFTKAVREEAERRNDVLLFSVKDLFI